MEEVQGPGVVGEFPIISPGKVYEYTSCTTFSTASGYMEGYYTFHCLFNKDRFFNVTIPRFYMVCPAFKVSTAWMATNPDGSAVDKDQVSTGPDDSWDPCRVLDIPAPSGCCPLMVTLLGFFSQINCLQKLNSLGLVHRNISDCCKWTLSHIRATSMNVGASSHIHWGTTSLSLVWKWGEGEECVWPLFIFFLKCETAWLSKVLISCIFEVLPIYDHTADMVWGFGFIQA